MSRSPVGGASCLWFYPWRAGSDSWSNVALRPGIGTTAMGWGGWGACLGRLHGGGAMGRLCVEMAGTCGRRREWFLTAARKFRNFSFTRLLGIRYSTPCAETRTLNGRLAQGESASLTRKRSQVQILYRPPLFTMSRSLCFGFFVARYAASVEAAIMMRTSRCKVSEKTFAVSEWGRHVHRARRGD